MNPLSPSRLVPAIALAAALGSAAACGGSEVEPGEGALGSSTSPSPATSAPAPTPTRTPKPTATATPTPTDDGGDGDAEGDDEPATRGGGVCRFVGADEVGALLGATVKGSAVPGETGCKFDQGGKSGTSVTILDKAAAAAGGMDGAKSEANSAVEGTPQDLSGIGSAAFVVTGAMFGGPDVNAAGAVQVGGRIISVYLVQRSGMAEAKVRAVEVDLLELVAREAS